MRSLLLLIVVFVCTGVLFSGHLHWKDKIASAGVNANLTVQQKEQQENEEKEATIARLNPEINDGQSTLDYLTYLALTKEQISVAVVGSNGTAGTGASHPLKTWPALLERGLKEEIPEIKNLNMDIQGYEGYTTADFLTSEKTNSVISKNPDLILIETAILNNYFQSISLEQTKNDIVNLVESFQKELPKAKIILLSPNPILNSDEKNQIDLTFGDYLNSSMNLINKKKWPYINSYELILEKMNGKNAVLADFITSDQFHLNDQGYYLWYEVIGEFLKENSLET